MTRAGAMITRRNRLKQNRSRFIRNVSLCGLLIIGILTGMFPRSSHADEWLKRPFPIDPDRQYAFAQSLYDARRFTRAAAEFERFVFLFPDHLRAFDARLQAARAYYSGGQYQEATAACNSAINEEPDRDVAQAYLLLSRCQVALNNFDQALITLHNLLSAAPAATIRDEARYLGAWIFIETARWPEARDWLQTISPHGRSRYSIEKLTSALSHTDKISYKNARLAGLLALVPGAGHLYTHRNQDALVAFFLNTASFWAAYEAFDNDQPVLGGLLSIVGINFYTGNIYSAVSSAHKYNRRSAKSFILDLKRRFSVRLIKGMDTHSGGVCVSFSF
ncbi:MAG: hypothetical protein DSY90_11035 [Deltaproteobacteria bacterium]|nr:MAG: hypothetical protein DSY90_11035 [Deltaproteobacteria bacterium]